MFDVRTLKFMYLAFPYFDIALCDNYKSVSLLTLHYHPYANPLEIWEIRFLELNVGPAGNNSRENICKDWLIHVKPLIRGAPRKQEARPQYVDTLQFNIRVCMHVGIIIQSNDRHQGDLHLWSTNAKWLNARSPTQLKSKSEAA